MENNTKDLLLTEIPDLVKIIKQQRSTICDLMEDLEKYKMLMNRTNNNLQNNNLQNDDMKCIEELYKQYKPSIDSLNAQILNINNLLNKVSKENNPSKIAHENKLISQKYYLVQKYIFDDMISENNAKYLCDKIKK